MPGARETEYAALVRDRKACRRCHGLVNPAECAGGRYDSDHIGPWSLWQGNLNADLLVVGQDWGDTRYLIDNQGHEKAGNRTNETLIKLLGSIDINVPRPAPQDSGGGPLFFTNAVLCLKHGGLQAKVDPAWFDNCGARFLKPTIDLIRPKVLVSLGEWAYRALVSLYALPRVRFRDAVDRQDGFRMPGGTRYLPMYHCGARILNTHRPLEQQLRDWERVRRCY